MIRWVVLALALAVGSTAWYFHGDDLQSGRVSSQADEGPVGWRAIDVTALPHTLRLDKQPDEPFQTGQLIYRGGLELQSDTENFGGFSGLWISDDGHDLIAMSDDADWLRATLRYDANGRLAGMNDAAMAPLIDADGKTLDADHADAEGLDRRGDEILVSFERKPRLDAYRIRPDGTIVFERMIRDYGDEAPLRTNKSLEGVTRLDDGTMIATIERGPDEAKGNSARVITASNAFAINFQRTEFFDATDIDSDGAQIFVLERHFSRKNGLHMRIATATLDSTTLAGANDQRADASPVILDELARFGLFHQIDNFEGLTVRRTNDGRTFIYVISDNNFSKRQRTLLLMFELAA